MYGLTAKETLDSLQSLYEKKLATYPRTDSRYLTDDMKETAEDVMYVVFDKLIRGDRGGFRPDATRLLNSKKVSDHHAIIPTSEIKAYDIEGLPEKEKKILYLISFRLLYAAVAPCEYTALKAELTIHELTFRASGKHIEKEGYKHYEDLLKAAFKQEKENLDDGEDLFDAPMVNLTEGQEIKEYETSLSEGITKAPSRYTEDSLLAAMENAGAKETTSEAERKGIGTPATRADIIEKLIHDGYAKREKKNLVVTELGTKLMAILPENLKSVTLTAEWENDLTMIAKGEADAEEFLSAIEEMVRGTIESHTESDPEYAELFLKKGGNSIGVCPNCGKSILKGKYGAYCEGKCGISLSYAYGKALSISEIESLLSGKKTMIKGLTSAKSKQYDAYLAMTGTGTYTYKNKDGDEKEGICLIYDMEFPKKVKPVKKKTKSKGRWE